ncbi:MAG: hypothetical protein LC648_00360 [Novosphingobium sp.]|nr:hypothetical protein [Novosphingobium sp.]
MELGFYETDINGREVIAHAGDTVAFHSDLHLFLNDGVGIFASFNSAGKDGAVGQLRTTLFERFADRYFPGQRDTHRVDPKTARQHSQILAGVYSNSRGSRSSFLHISDLLGQAKVGVGKDGEVVLPIANGLNGQPRRWVKRRRSSGSISTTTSGSPRWSRTARWCASAWAALPRSWCSTALPGTSRRRC